MGTRVNTRVNHAAIIRLQVQTSNRLAFNAAKATQARLRRLAPKKTGRLAESFVIVPLRVGARTSYKVTSPLKYAEYQNRGTGPIYPKKAKALRFEAGGSIVFAKSTKGVPATHFIDRARAMITVHDFT